MKMTFRWYGDSDPVSLEHIRQIPGMDGIVSAVYDVPVGAVWPIENIRKLKASIEAHGLSFDVIESVPVHEDIKLGKPARDTLIENYCQTLRNLGACGLKVVCYNFMPVFDWTRTTLEKKLPDGSITLAFEMEKVRQIDPSQGIHLPGWDASYKPAELQALLNEYKHVDEERLWQNLEYFLKKIIPVATEAKLKMAIHPDDPPRPIFGLPRIVKNRDDLARLLAIVDVPANGLTLCSGSLGGEFHNDIPAMIREFAGRGRIHFAHVRNVAVDEDGNFHETAHNSASGSLDMAEIMRAYYEANYQGYIRPDHGRGVWDEQRTRPNYRPGYGLYDRAMGATYIKGLWEGIAAEKRCKR